MFGAPAPVRDGEGVKVGERIIGVTGTAARSRYRLATALPRP
ncbi:hypothetical protein [Actinophytocola xinjiangensis]|nr:hypothetical protein [Actinophytocola xinjiangensis]